MEKPKGDPCEMSRRDLLQGIVKGSAIAGAVGLVGSDVLGFTGSTIPANAADKYITPYNTPMVGKSANQNRLRSAYKAENHKSLDWSRAGEFEPSLPDQGCFVFSAYVALVKTKSFGSKKSIIDFATEMHNAGAISSWCAMVNPSAGLRAYGATWVQDNPSLRDAASIEKELAKGGVVIVGVGGNGTGGSSNHYMVVDYVKDGEIYVHDTGEFQGGPALSSLIGNFSPASITQAAVLVGKVPANTEPNILDGGSSGTDKPKEKEEKSTGGGGGMLSEEDLRGMEHFKQYKSSIDAMESKVNKTAPPTLASLGISEQNQISKLESAIRDGKKTPQDYLGVGVSFVGLLGMVYSMFMFVTFLFDRSNNIIDANLLRKLTFGKMETVHDPEDVREEGGTRFVSWKGILTWVGLCIVISLLLLTGALFDFISWFAQIVRGS